MSVRGEYEIPRRVVFEVIEDFEGRFTFAQLIDFEADQFLAPAQIGDGAGEVLTVGGNIDVEDVDAVVEFMTGFEFAIR